MDSQNTITITEVNNFVETLKNNEHIVEAIITLTKDKALESIREKAYDFLREKQLKSVYVVEIKDSIFIADKLSEYAYKEIKKHLEKRTSSNSVDAPETTNPNKNEPITPMADNGEKSLQAQNEQYSAPTTSEHVQHTQNIQTVNYKPSTPVSPSTTTLYSFTISIPEHLMERVREGSLNSQNARIEFLRFYTSALRTEHINEYTPCELVRLNESNSLTQAAKGKTIVDLCCDFAEAIVFGKMKEIGNILNSQTHQPQTQSPVTQPLSHTLLSLVYTPILTLLQQPLKRFLQFLTNKSTHTNNPQPQLVEMLQTKQTTSHPRLK